MMSNYTLPETLPYDAILIVSFGGPEGMDDVIPFLENVLHGRNVPRARLEEVAHHYTLFDGVSPINQQNRNLIAALQQELDAHGPQLPIYWGNRNWHPFLTDTMQQMADDGVQRALAFFTSMYSCYSGCRQYREDLYRAREAVGESAPAVDKIRMAYNHPLFIDANADCVRTVLEQIPAERRSATQIVFTAHSLPLAMARNSRYEAQLRETSDLVAKALGHENWTLVYQSRSGPPHQPWLEPDVCDYLEEQHAQGVTDVVVAPVGFISDHMEVIYDLDTEAKELADEMGLNMVRAASVGTHPSFIRMIRELIVERMVDRPERRAIGRYPANHDVCPATCCLSGRPGDPLPAVAQLQPDAA